MLGIIGAMKEEVDEVVALMKVIDEKEDCGYHFYHGFLGNKETVVVQGGIGKVNATISTTILLKDYDIDHVINVGSAGGLNLEEEVGDVVIGERVSHHDFDLTSFGRAMGEVPDMPVSFLADPKMVQLAKEILEENGTHAYVGLIASGDQFVSTKKQVERIKKYFPDAMCAEMEAASIAQVCYVFKKPFIITRGLSDIFDKGENPIQFDTYLKKAAKTSAKMCYQLANKL